MSISQARRRFRRVLKLAEQGHTFILTRCGKPVCRLELGE
ncbi:type II toxin-antitoxin system Phd/YefM family antitoxin [Pseudomonas putida]|nr:type II toxin-antitoxin system Phd/YefM family antitoxin [Pseudomonas putida]MDF3926331.1 type II toxin-antitoxin system Phd/YefM family antitoxin [Pseudomonas putida]